jgi:vacuolar-type H+-ATPase subunit E/Vma4
MSILEIEKRIIEEAEAEAARLRKGSEAKIRDLGKLHAQKLAEVREQSLRQAQRQAAAVKRSQVVPARLTARKALLAEKQKILSKIYAEIKKVKKLSDAEVGKLREDSEVKAASILFGE